MERLENNRKNYVKPVTSLVDFDKDLCEILNVPCGATNFVTSTNSYQEFQICVHFTTEEWVSGKKRNVYAKNNGSAMVISIKGQHKITFMEDTNAYCNPSITDGDEGGCGWQQYRTDDNGACHYFGLVYVDDQLITKNGGLPTGVSKVN